MRVLCRMGHCFTWRAVRDFDSGLVYEMLEETDLETCRVTRRRSMGRPAPGRAGLSASSRIRTAKETRATTSIERHT